jgi:two-component system cell cycle response regulator DivK
MSEEYAVIIEDNRLNVDILAMLLKKEGMDYLVARTPADIPALLDQDHAIKVIFLDIQFPDYNGFEVLEGLKADGRLANVPVVAYTMHTSEINKARSAGFHSFLGKPLDAHKFPDQLRRILNGESVWA